MVPFFIVALILTFIGASFKLIAPSRTSSETNRLDWLRFGVSVIQSAVLTRKDRQSSATMGNPSGL